MLFGERAPLSQERRYASDQDLTLDTTAPASEEEGKWTFTADRIAAEHDSDYVEAEGNATFTNGKNTLRADFARYYRDTGWVLLRGNVRAMWEGDFMEASEAEFDLNKKEGWLKDGKVFLVKPHMYFESSYIRKYSGASYTFKEAKVTTCSGATPAWSIHAEEGDITLDGYAKLWHTTFRVRDTPIAYLPYMKLPTGGGKRQSGFLMPELSNSSRFGITVNLPYYWVINDEVDATFYQNFMSNRGYMQGLELRHANDAHTKGYWRFDWLHDAVVYKDMDDEPGYVDDDDLLRSNRSRWWLRSKFNGYLGTPAWRTMVDLDLVSDHDYLREFNRGANGYQTSRDEMLDEFGRDINKLDDETRTSKAMLARDYDSFGLAAKLEYNQNPAYMNGNNKASQDPSLQRLPELDAFLFKDTVGSTPLELEAQAKYDYFTREKGTTGHRLDLRPTLSLPLHTTALTVIPHIGARGTFYNVDDWETNGNTTLANGQVEGNHTSEDDTPMSLTVEAGVSLFSELYRTYSLDSPPLALSEDNLDEERWTDIKHSIVPRVDYNYIPRKTGQSDLPYFDERDRVFGENRVSYSLTNVLDRKREYVTLGPDGSTPVVESDYLDFARFRLAQSYDRLEATRMDELNSYERRPFSDVLAEIVLQPLAGLELSSKTWYSPYMARVTEHEHMIRYTYEGVGDVFFAYDFLDKVDEYNRRRENTMQVLHLGGNFYVMQNLVLGLEYRTDLNSGTDLEKTVRLMWQGECYDLGLQFTRSEEDSRVGLHFNIMKF